MPDLTAPAARHPPNDLAEKFLEMLLSVPVRLKIIGIMLLPTLILGIALNYWITTGLSDWLSYLLSNERVAVAMQAGSRSVLLVTIAAVIASLLLAFVPILLLTRPLLELRWVAQQVTAGHLDARARVWANDEIGEVARSVNLMLGQIQEKQAALERSNRQLEALNRVALAAGRKLDLAELLDTSLRTTLEVMGLSGGCIYLKDPTGVSGETMNLAVARGPDGQWADADAAAAAGLCATETALLAGSLGLEARPCQCRGASQRHINIPLAMRGRPFGLISLNWLADMPPSADDLGLLTTIGAQVSELVSNAWLHASLVEKEAARQVLLKALVRAQEDERARLARELHDGAGQTLTSLLMHLSALANHADNGAARQQLHDLCQKTSSTIEQVRDIAYQLRPPALEEFGLEVAITSLVDEVANGAHLQADCQLSLDGQRLPFEIETTLYRIAQESLTNIVRHAAAHKIKVELLALPYAACLRIADDGRGFDPEAAGAAAGKKRLGLLSLHERAEMVGGSLVVRSAPGAGTTVEVSLPCLVETDLPAGGEP